jgi:hypothetical protein
MRQMCRAVISPATDARTISVVIDFISGERRVSGRCALANLPKKARLMHGVYQSNFCDRNKLGRDPNRRILSNCRIVSAEGSGAIAPLLPYSNLGSVSQFIDAKAGNFGFKRLPWNF